jgi:fucose 4-O-acetylase-like acetyltransferase
MIKHRQEPGSSVDLPAGGLGLQSARIAWVDSAKGLGIILVIVGHVERGLVSSQTIQNTQAVRFLDAWIYSFHMPLFFFLSGLFLYKSAVQSDFLSFATDKLRTVLYPYFVWSIVVIVLKSCLGNLPNKPRSLDDLLKIPTDPMEQFWYLYVLFILIIFFGALLALGMKPWITVVIAALILPTTIPYFFGWSTAVDLGRGNAIFLALGVIAGKSGHLPDGTGKLPVLGLVALLGYASPALAIWCNNGADFAIGLALSGTVAVAASSMLINNLGWVGHTANFIGRNALEIYVSHTIFSAATRIALVHLSIENPAIHYLLGTIAGLTGPLLLVIVLKLTGFRFGFTFPVAKRSSALLKTKQSAEKA